MAYTIIATQHSQASNGTLSRVNNKFLTVEGSNLTAKEIKTEKSEFKKENKTVKQTVKTAEKEVKPKVKKTIKK